ncbi:MAG: fibronectin type III-like domain-contianing protein [Pseudomonadota bacterium]
MTDDAGELLPFQDDERELEDRLDDLLQYKPDGGWTVVLDSLEALTKLPAEAEPVAQHGDAAPVVPADDPAAHAYEAAMRAPLRLIRFEAAAAEADQLRLLEPLVLATCFSPELIRELAFAASRTLRQRGIELVVIPPIRLADATEVPLDSYGCDPYLAGRVATALVRGAAGRDRRTGVSLVLDCGTGLLAPLTEEQGDGLMAWRERLLEPVAEMVRDGGLRLLLVQQQPAAPVAGADLRAELGEDGLLLVAGTPSTGTPDAAPLVALAETLNAELLLGTAAARAAVWSPLGEREARRRAARVLRLKLILGMLNSAPAPEAVAVDVDRLRARLALASMVQLHNERALPVAARARVQVLVSHELGPAVRDLLSAAFAESNVNSRVTQLADGGLSGDPEALQAQLDELARDADLMVWLTPSAMPTRLLIQSTLLAAQVMLLRVLVGPQTVPDIEVAAEAAGLLQLFGPTETSLRLLPAVLEGSRLASGRLAHRAYEPAFAFGTGAAGTAVVYEALTGPTAADTFSVIVLSQTVRNTGQHTIVEVLQLYLRRPDGADDQLLGFARCALKAGEAARVRLQLDSSLLAQVGSDGVWRVEPGIVALYVGGSIAAPEARFEIELTGEPRALKQQQRVSTLVSIESLGGDEPD